MMKYILVLLLSQPIFATTSLPTFRFHLVNEPKDFNFAASGSTSSYLQNILSRSLYKYDDTKGLTLDWAKSCTWKNKTTYHCKLNKALWSDGTPLLASQYVDALRDLIDPKSRFAKQNLLLPLKNAKSILLGTLDKNKLGVRATADDELMFDLETENTSLPYILSHPFLTPKSKKIGYISSGPYFVSDWKKRQKIQLHPNPFFPRSNRLPPVEVLFIQEDSVALNLYEKGELTFLRRLPTQFIDKYKMRKDFFQIPVSRFDYIGFGPVLDSQPELRAALSSSINFKDWQLLLKSLGQPGCSGLPISISEQQPCLTFDPEIAKKKLLGQKLETLDLEIVYSRQGGDDHKRSMEWLQAEWKKNLNLKIKVKSMDNIAFTDRLSKDTPTIFRRGLGLDYPSCLQALETFTTTSPENYSKVNSAELDLIVENLKTVKNETEQKALCLKGLKTLLGTNKIIPLGEIHFTILVNPTWSGLKLNSLNQLDLSELAYIKQ